MAKKRLSEVLIPYILITVFLLVVIIAVSGSVGGAGSVSAGESRKSLIIFAATNLEPVMVQLQNAYEEYVGEQLNWDIRFGSSGNLAQQLLMGAQADIFLSADEKYPRLLRQESLGLADPLQYTRGRLALVYSGSEKQLEQLYLNAGLNMGKNTSRYILSEMKQLIDSVDGTMGFYMANPELAPYGKAAAMLLKNSDIRVTDPILGDNAARTAQFLSQGGGIGILPLSIAMDMTSEKDLHVLGELPVPTPAMSGAESHESGSILDQSYLILRSGLAESFSAWLRGPGQEIFSANGYSTLGGGS